MTSIKKLIYNNKINLIKQLYSLYDITNALNSIITDFEKSTDGLLEIKLGCLTFYIRRNNRCTRMQESVDIGIYTMRRPENTDGFTYYFKSIDSNRDKILIEAVNFLLINLNSDYEI